MQSASEPRRVAAAHAPGPARSEGAFSVRWEEPSYGARELELIERALLDPTEFRANDEFERVLGSWIGTDRVATCSNGTVAILLALMLHGVGEGDEVIFPTYTFASVVNCAILLGAQPLLVDSEPETINLDLNLVEDLLRQRSKVRAVVYVDVGGIPPDYEQLYHLRDRYGIAVIEDAAEGLGSEVAGRRVGTMSHIATLSFQSAKQLGAGEGGALALPDDRLMERTRLLRNHGMGAAARYVHTDMGLNFRMSALNAAVGLAQIERLEAFIQHRERIMDEYRTRLGHIVRFQHLPSASRISWGMALVRMTNRPQRDAVVAALTHAGVETRINWKPVHQQPYHGYLALQDYPVADATFETSLTLPISNSLKFEEAHRICEVVESALS